MQQFTNHAIDLDLLPKYEAVTLTRPDKKYWKVITINLILFVTCIGASLAAILILKEEARTYWMIWICIYIGFVIALLLIYRISFKRRGFALREKDILYKSGIIAEKTTIIPLNRIQHVALNEGFLSRMLHLGTLQIYTAGGSSGEIRIAGIPIERAKALKETLVQRLIVTAKTDVL